mmetsp:Transcript_17897/g.48166  ORF Transcript_17897/g.48166 Transcript_17897/m.48166 type:complete len:206 (+) Transcript_17897:614-1231(+)
MPASPSPRCGCTRRTLSSAGASSRQLARSLGQPLGVRPRIKSSNPTSSSNSSWARSTGAARSTRSTSRGRPIRRARGSPWPSSRAPSPSTSARAPSTNSLLGSHSSTCPSSCGSPSSTSRRPLRRTTCACVRCIEGCSSAPSTSRSGSAWRGGSTRQVVLLPVGRPSQKRMTTSRPRGRSSNGLPCSRAGCKSRARAVTTIQWPR